MIRNGNNTNDVIANINKRLDELYHKDEEGMKPFVCLICDEFVNVKNVQRLSEEMLQKNSYLFIPDDWNSVPRSLAECYRYNGNKGRYNEIATNESRIEHMLLSPRACYLTLRDRRTVDGFSCCMECKNMVCRGKLPRKAIANNFCFGTPPSCLLDLTEVELALLTPVKSYGYCFTFTGGQQKQLKGSLAYYKVDMNSIAEAVMHFDALGLNNNIVVLLYGKMTLAQQLKAREKGRVRTEFVLKAVEWLSNNNEEWIKRKIDLCAIRQKLVNPLVVDNSVVVENSTTANNIEMTESFQVFFPDGTMSPVTGGQESMEKYNEMIKAAINSGYDVGFKTNLMKEAVADFKDNNLVNACLLQFPFGRGGMHEVRKQDNDCITSYTDIEFYVQHLSRISQRHFHYELFSLILYNLSMKQAMVRNAGWKVRNKCDAKALAEELTMEDVTKAISTKLSTNRKRSFGVESKLISAIDAMAKAVPHTNEAARAARANGECIQHHFGTPSVFLTVTPDDENSFLVQLFTNEHNDIISPVVNTTDYELTNAARNRTVLRIKYPGICALNFEYIVDIVIEEVIGWDIKEGKAREDKQGLLGVPEAFTITVEEQGRKTLHTHIQVWIKGFDDVRENLHSSCRLERKISEDIITRFVDDISTCSLMTVEHRSDDKFKEAFDHNCTVSRRRDRSIPMIVDDQSLRNLRQRICTNMAIEEEVFAYCPHCLQTWSNNVFLETYLVNYLKVPSLAKFPEGEERRLKSMALQYQQNGNDEFNMIKSVINAAYNHHRHTKSCFERHNSECKNDKKDEIQECRYRYPQSPQKRTTIKNASENPVPWYKWDGTRTERYIKEVCPKRNEYDVFQNICCPAISYSKVACNTNVAVVMPGPIGQYQFKYILKGTQKEDTKEYGNVKDAMQKILSGMRKHESDRSESVRRLLAASFAHQKTNIVGASMASYLTRNKTRFRFSHNITWCPLKDIRNLLEGGEASSLIIQSNNQPFFQCSALHYLCRPNELKGISAFDFYSKYEVVRSVNNSRDTLLQFTKRHPLFNHPSYRKKSNKFLQGVRERSTPHLVKVHQYDFPDSAEFGGSLLDENVPITETMENYSKLVLLLFVPCRILSDVTIDGSFTKRLRKAVETNEINKDAMRYMQNLQDTRSNSFRVSKIEDDLQRRTELILNHTEKDTASDENSNSQEEHVTTPEDIDNFLEYLDAEGYENNDDEELHDYDSWITPESINLAGIRLKGTERCGYSGLTGMGLINRSTDAAFLEIEHCSIPATIDDGIRVDDFTTSNLVPSHHDIIKVLLTRTRRRRKTFEEISRKHKEVTVLQANGSFLSIIDWARKAKLDSGQRRAFETIVSSFVLTFYTNHEEANVTGNREDRRAYLVERRRLRALAESRRRGSNQLIMFLHGPGGSGKTTVIDLVTTYAEEYCNYLENFEYNQNVIRVTAMTGVAATILLGETTHSAVYLNQQRPIEPDQIEQWGPTRLLIIDEISFASKEDFEELDYKLRCLKQQLRKVYGGINIVFSGDMRQLEPVGAFKKPVYSQNCAQFRDFVNSYVELKGMHRFKNDPEWGKLLRRFREGTVTIDDIRAINERVVRNGMKIPDDIRYATYFNRDRDSINTALFEERCKSVFNQNGQIDDTVLIFSDNLFVQDGSKNFVRLRNCVSFWENCGEDSVSLPKGKGRMDPLLKLYTGCRVMLTTNKSVREGQANGTQATVEKVVLKHGVQPTKVSICGNIPVPSVTASQVSHIVLRHSNDRIHPPSFNVFPRQNILRAKMLKPRALQVRGNDRETVKMKATQVPIVVNNATTGHKLQGSGVDTLFVHNWSYITNWVYVMLSRVKTRKGLYCRKPLTEDLDKYAVPEALTKMIDNFSDRLASEWTEQEYNVIYNLCSTNPLHGC